MACASRSSGSRYPGSECPVGTPVGATGAILLESAGEAVQWHNADESQSERLRLRSAYVAVVLQNSRALAARTLMGEGSRWVMQYDGASFIAQMIERDYDRASAHASEVAREYFAADRVLGPMLSQAI